MWRLVCVTLIPLPHANFPSSLLPSPSSLPPPSSLPQLTAATQAFFDKFHMQQNPSSIPTGSSFDFPKPRHVQITVTDAGVCMPLVSLVRRA